MENLRLIYRNSFCILFTTVVLLAVTKSVSGQGSVSNAASDMVSGFTGDFNYAVPLLEVPSKSGVSINLNLQYNGGGGVKVEDESSWVGLGWGLNVGEITRNVNGVPDDWKNQPTKQYKIKRFNEESNEEPNDEPNVLASVPDIKNNTNYFGSLYFKDIDYSQQNYAMEMNLHNFSDDVTARFPDYDDYYISAPFFSGKISPKHFEYATLSFSNNLLSASEAAAINNFNPNNDNLDCKAFSKPVNFHFIDDYAASTKVNNPRHYPNSAYPPQTTNISGDGYNATNNRTYTAKQVRYFTNQEIRSNYNNLSQNFGFIETDDIDRNSTLCDADGIGAFQVIDENGTIYHYSLPVYQFSDTITNFSLSNNAIDITKDISQTIWTKAYAISWKLTAITGIDYQDINENGIADVGDVGYWVTYKYGKWCDNFYNIYPKTGFLLNYQMNHKLKNPGDIKANPQDPRDYNIDYSSDGTVIKKNHEIYYINSIETSSHKAFFVKDIKYDDYSSGEYAVPKLYLKRIMLFKNENFDYNTLQASSEIATEISSNGFSSNNLSLPVGDDVLDEYDYQQNKSIIDPNVAASIEFKYDYRLCKNYIGNIKTSASYTNYDYPVIYNIDVVNNVVDDDLQRIYKKVATTNSTANNTNGKLTLNEVQFYSLGNSKLMAPYLFNYTNNDFINGTKNPNYDSDLVDAWGYYKSDRKDNTGAIVRGLYPSFVSKDNLDVWALRKITNPLGAEIHVEYESDLIDNAYLNGKADVNDFGGISFFDKPRVKFLINDAIRTPNTNCTGSPNDFTCSFDITVLDKNFFDIWNAPENISKVLFYIQNVDDKPDNNIEHTISGTNLTNTIQSYIVNNNTITSNRFDSPVNFKTNPPFNSNSPFVYTNLGFIEIELKKFWGGGIRVKEIKIKEPYKIENYASTFEYKEGICGYIPDKYSISRVDEEYIYRNKLTSAAFFSLPFDYYGTNYSGICDVVGSNIFPAQDLPVYVYDTYSDVLFVLYKTYQTGDENIGPEYLPCVEGRHYSVFSNEIIDRYNLTSSKGKILELSNYNTVSHLVGTGVGYSYVRVKEKGDDGIVKNSKLFNYENYSLKNIAITSRCNGGNQEEKCEVSIKDHINDLLGRLKKIEYYDNNNNLVGHEKYVYFQSNNVNINQALYMAEDNEIPVDDNQSEISEIFHNKIEFKGPNANLNLLLRQYNLHTYYKYALQKHIVVKDGVHSITTYRKRNKFGQPEIVENYDATNGLLKREIEYVANSNSVLGSLVDNVNNKNLLAGIEKNSSSFYDAENGQYTMIDGSYNKWDNNRFIRKLNINNGAYENVSTNNLWNIQNTYTYNEQPNPLDWKLNSTITLYDEYNSVLEVRNIAFKYNAAKYYSDKNMLSKISNSRYSAFTHSSAELIAATNYTDGEVMIQKNNNASRILATTQNIQAHTGDYVIKIDPNSEGMYFKGVLNAEDKGRGYRGSVWVNSKNILPSNITNAKLVFKVYTNGGVLSNTIEADLTNAVLINNWYLVNINMIMPKGNINLSHFEVFVKNTANSVSIYADDIQVAPVDAGIESYVYDHKFDLITYSIDAENFYTKYEYDIAGRLIKTFRETEKGIVKMSEQQYNYVRKP